MAVPSTPDSPKCTAGGDANENINNSKINQFIKQTSLVFMILYVQRMESTDYVCSSKDEKKYYLEMIM